MRSGGWPEAATLDGGCGRKQGFVVRAAFGASEWLLHGWPPQGRPNMHLIPYYEETRHEWSFVGPRGHTRLHSSQNSAHEPDFEGQLPPDSQHRSTRQPRPPSAARSQVTFHSAIRPTQPKPAERLNNSYLSQPPQREPRPQGRPKGAPPSRLARSDGRALSDELSPQIRELAPIALAPQPRQHLIRKP